MWPRAIYCGRRGGGLWCQVDGANLGRFMNDAQDAVGGGRRGKTVSPMRNARLHGRPSGRHRLERRRHHDHWYGEVV